MIPAYTHVRWMINYAMEQIWAPNKVKTALQASLTLMAHFGVRARLVLHVVNFPIRPRQSPLHPLVSDILNIETVKISTNKHRFGQFLTCENGRESLETGQYASCDLQTSRESTYSLRYTKSH